MRRGLRLDRHIARLRTAFAPMVLNPAGGGVRPSVFVAGSATLIAIWALSGVYEVGADQSGMVTRFGAFVGETGPGVHYHLPAPIERVRKLSVGTVNRLDLGPGEDADAAEAAPMLTRDGDAAAVDFSVQWRIVDPYKYLYQLAYPDSFLRRAAEEAMRGAVGEVAFSDVAAAAHGGAPALATARLRARLDRADAGIEVVDVVIRDAAPPDSAQGGFHDMAAAREDTQIAARDAGAYRDRILAEARGDAAKTVQASQGYRDQEISEAKGEADRFALVDAQYRKFPDVTRERLYTEMMERVLHATSKVIVQPGKGSTGQIVLPPELFRPRPVEPSGQVPSGQGAAGPGPSPSQPQTQPQAQAGAGAGAQPGPTA